MIEYPELIQIETTSACNARCPYCPHHQMPLRGKMAEPLFKEILDQLAQWAQPPAKIYPFLNGEPFADPRLIKWCQEINRRLPRTQLGFYTNGELLTKVMQDGLMDLRNVEQVVFSIRTHRDLEYRDVFGLEMRTVVDNLHDLLARKSPFAIKAVKVRTSPDQDADFKAWFLKEFQGWPVSLAWSDVSNWAGAIPSTVSAEGTLDRHCSRLNHLCILTTGQLALCCLDYLGEWGYGSVQSGNILETYNSATAKRRRSLQKREQDPCRCCNQTS